MKTTAKMKAKTLVQSWLEVELVFNNKTLAEALRDLNKHLNSAHTHSRVREWEENRNGRGARLPREIRLYMAKVVLRHVLESSGVNASTLASRAISRIAEQLC
jgi:hypothetical protein